MHVSTLWRWQPFKCTWPHKGGACSVASAAARKHPTSGEKQTVVQKCGLPMSFLIAPLSISSQSIVHTICCFKLMYSSSSLFIMEVISLALPHRPAPQQEKRKARHTRIMSANLRHYGIWNNQSALPGLMVWVGVQLVTLSFWLNTP